MSDGSGIRKTFDNDVEKTMKRRKKDKCYSDDPFSEKREKRG